jgi:ABC-type multidrug transport system ATPase subunit
MRSGAGKSTLLNVLSQRLVPGAGELRLDNFTVGTLCQREHLRNLTAFTEQEMPLIGSLSIRETLEFAHRLAVPASNGNAKRHGLISKVLLYAILR